MTSQASKREPSTHAESEFARALFELHQLALYRYLNRLLHSREEAREIPQDTYLRLLRQPSLDHVRKNARASTRAESRSAGVRRALPGQDARREAFASTPAKLNVSPAVIERCAAPDPQPNTVETPMPVLGLEHVNIRTPELERTIAFFRDVLSMKVGPSPNGTSTENGAWVFDANGVAVVHLARVGFAYPSDEKMPFKPSRGSGAVHHVALRCSGFDETMGRIKALGLEFFENYVPQVKLRQIFVSEANGILFELNFAGEAA